MISRDDDGEDLRRLAGVALICGSLAWRFTTWKPTPDGEDFKCRVVLERSRCG
jgi:hypothetical protein